MTPAVSVITASHNYGRYLGDALRSVQLQTFTDWECVLIDDGSRDNTPEVVRPFLTDPRFRYIRSDNLGQTRAKNLSFRLCHSPLIAFLDGDDVWLPTKLARQVRLFEAEPQVGAVFTRRFLINHEGEIIPSRHVPFFRGMILDNVRLDNFVCFSSVMARRQVVEHVGSFDNRLELAIDYDLWVRATGHYRFDFIDEPLVKYRTGPGHGNLSQRIIDRLTLVLSIIRRDLNRRGRAVEMSPAVRRETWGSTCRTMGFVHRDSDPRASAGWYLRAAAHDRKWGATLKAIARIVSKRLRSASA